MDDVEQIRQVLARFGHARDDGDGAALAALLTDDVVVEIGGTPPRLWSGRDAVVTSYSVPPPGRHLYANSEISVAGVSATAKSDVIMLSPACEVLGMARYDDEFRRGEQGWQLSARRASVFGQRADPARPE